jgi:hypothetical protein
MWNLLLPSIVTLGGYLIGAEQNKRAAEIASRTALQGAQIAADAIREGSREAQATLNQIRAETAPATSYLRRVVAEPGELTPQQVVALNELRRNLANQIRGSNFAGSGRTSAALFRKVESDFVNEALAQNRARADAAANQMFGAGANAASAVAGNQAATGQRVGQLIGGATQQAGLYEAQSGLATGRLAGQALGDIGALLAGQARESRYADRLRSSLSNYSVS